MVKKAPRRTAEGAYRAAYRTGDEGGQPRHRQGHLVTLFDAVKADLAALRATTPDVLLLDPPYESGAGAVALDKLNRLGWIAPGAWISVETARTETIDVKGFTVEATRDSGKARLHLLRLASAA